MSTAAARRCMYARLLLLLVCGAAAIDAQVIPFKPPKNNVSTCRSITQCYVMKLGAPQTQGEWMTAYISALHEHCAGLLQFGGPQDCSESIRCVYLKPDGSIMSSSSTSSSSTDGTASFLAAPNTSSTDGFSAGTNESTPAAAAYWKSVASALELKQPTCVPIPSRVESMRYRACAWARGQRSGPSDKAVKHMSDHCDRNPASCFMRNATQAADFEKWWTGPSPRAHLESSSSWNDAGKLQRVAAECGQAWQEQNAQVSDSCATRGIGTAPWNNSLMLNRVVVALVDAYESSACNNTVAWSEAMAVQKIIDDLCTSTNCKARSSNAHKQQALAPLLAAALACVWAAVLV